MPNLAGSNFTRAGMLWANLSGATATDGVFARTDFSHSRLVGVKARACDCTDASFVQAVARGADFRFATLALANCTGTDFTDADLSDVELTRTLLHGTTLARARFARATFQRTVIADCPDLATALEMSERFVNDLTVVAS